MILGVVIPPLRTQGTAAFLRDQAKHTIAREQSPKRGVEHDKLSDTGVFIPKPQYIVEEKRQYQASNATPPRLSPINHYDKHLFSSAFTVVIR